jgi:hypothetical protein
MAFSKKTWKDRISQYINRRLLTDSDGNTQQVTVTRDEGSVTEPGDAFSAANMNDLENRIEAAIPVKIQDLDNVTLTTSDNNKLLGVSVSGSDISVGAVEINNYKRLYVLEYNFGAVQANQEYSVSLATLTNNIITNLSQIGSFALTQCGGASNWDHGAVIWIKNSTPTTLTFIPSLSQNDCRVWILFLYK